MATLKSIKILHFGDDDMAVKHGTIGEFDSGIEDWTSYTERLEQYFVANNVGEDKQQATLLSVCGSQTYLLLKSLLAPVKPAEKSYEEIVQILKDYYQPKPTVIVERFNFHSRYRKQEETVANFVAELRKLAGHCQFGDSLSDMLRDRLVCGINDKWIQHRLLAEPDLTFKRAFELAQGLEIADRNLLDLETPQSEVVNVMKTRGTDYSCYHCGGKHRATDCRFKQLICYNCHKQGHLARVCKSKGRSERKEGPAEGLAVHRETFQVQYEEQGQQSEPEYALFHFSDRSLEPIVVSPLLKGVELLMEVDTGATRSIISQCTYQRLWSGADAPPLCSTTARLKTYTREVIRVLGEIQVEVSLNHQKENLSLLIVEGDGPSLLGRDWLQKVKLDWGKIHHMSESKLHTILGNHSSVFKDELGCVKDIKAKIYVEENGIPKFCRARRYAL